MKKPTLFIHLSNGNWLAVQLKRKRDADTLDEFLQLALESFGATGFQFVESGNLQDVLPNVDVSSIFPFNY